MTTDGICVIVLSGDGIAKNPLKGKETKVVYDPNLEPEGYSARARRADKWKGSTPTHCNLCNDDFNLTFIDGKTHMGPWALMCHNCFRVHGVGIGAGKGQRYDLETLEKIEG